MPTTEHDPGILMKSEDPMHLLFKEQFDNALNALPLLDPAEGVSQAATLGEPGINRILRQSPAVVISFQPNRGDEYYSIEEGLKGIWLPKDSRYDLKYPHAGILDEAEEFGEIRDIGLN